MNFGQIIEGAFRQVIFMLDKFIYYLLEGAYNVLQEIAGVHLLGNDVISSFSGRIYTFLAIFMLFKVAVSLINYFLNPDAFNDSKNGMGSVLKRIAVSFVLIIAVPIVFTMGYELQDLILKNQILPAVIMGESSEVDYSDAVEKGGNTISMTIFKSFFRAKNVTLDDDGNVIDDPLIKQITEASANSKTGISGFASAVSAKTNGDFTYEYMIPLSTIAGGLAAWVLVMYCFDVGMRVVKLTFLELIAPVPIMSYIDPKKGDGIFKKWVSTCVSAYLQVFLYLIVLYFVIYIITAFAGSGFKVFSGASGNVVSVSIFARVFIILGLLLFMKEAPKMIADIFGIKDLGGFTLNPIKKLGDNAFIGGIAGAITGAGAGAYANMQAQKQIGRGDLAAASALGGAFTGLYRGGRAGFNSKGDLVQDISKGFEASLYGSRKIIARGNPDNTEFVARNMAKVQDKFRSKTEADLIDEQIKSYDTFAKAGSDFKSKARAEVEKHKGGAYGESAKLKATLDALKSMDTSKMDDTSLNAHVQRIVAANQAYEDQIGEDIKVEMDKQLSAYEQGNFEKATAAKEIAVLQKELKENSSYYSDLNIDITTGDNIQAAQKTATREAIALDTAENTIKARANRDYAKNSRDFGRPGSGKK